MSDLIDTTEMFLKAIYELDELGAPALRARLAERLEQAVPSVSQTIARMEREGLVALDTDRHLQLTDLGRQRATSVLRKHRMAERFLHDVLGLDWAKCHDEACRWEHVITDEAEVLMAKLLTTLDTDPYGNPIPGLEQLGLTPSSAIAPRRTVVDALPADGTGEFRLTAIAEAAQARPDFLRQLRGAELGIGSTCTVSRLGTTFAIAVHGVEAARFDRHVAEQVFVAAI